MIKVYCDVTPFGSKLYVQGFAPTLNRTDIEINCVAYIFICNTCYASGTEPKAEDGLFVRLAELVGEKDVTSIDEGSRKRCFWKIDKETHK